ncbi:MAG: indolepyruvate ferredoxin oxidoreductase subunit alpha [Methanomicrobia archaeon]|nr:indolepyruvate ferredoxin oxidoreductase subunit alpha [Methanomicrobia archaeon]
MKKELLMGNEAIARGAVEAGVSFVSAYPGTPSSEIPATIAKIADKYEIYMEYSINEKVAFEVALGASWSNLRAMVTMKHVGVNVAADPLMSVAYAGTDGGFVLVSADDPSMHSSQNEQDNRYYAKFANIPCLEPSSPQEAKDMTIKAFEISEKFKLPVILRPTTRVSHSRGGVILGDIREKNAVKWKKDPKRKVTLPAYARIFHPELLKKIKEVEKYFENSEFNWREGSGELGIIASGLSYNYVKEALKYLDMQAEVLKLGTMHPIPRKTVLEFMKDHKEILIVEEMEPIVETETKKIAQEEELQIKIHGKDILPLCYEYSTMQVAQAIGKLLGRKIEIPDPDVSGYMVPRPPVLCPGCPHRASYYALKKVAPDGIYPGDIGCYTLAALPPLLAMDTCFCMGGSIGISCGFSQAMKDKKIITTLGDSTFFHTGIPAMINGVYNQDDFTIFLLDNRTTAMTGRQPHPGTGKTGTGKDTVMLYPEKIAESMGVFTRVVDPYNLDETVKALKEAIDYKGVAMVVARRECVLLTKPEAKPYYIDEEKCTHCFICVNKLGCPAIVKDGDKVYIDEKFCTSCGVCAQICPAHAIEVIK